MTYVDVGLTNDVGTITLHDPATRNALGTHMVEAIIHALDDLLARNARVVVLRADGMGVWSSGHNINELPEGRRDPLAYDDPLECCLRAVRSTRLPVIAMVHGSVWGGAVDLVMSCDLVIADETATFAITPANLGLPYNITGLLHFLGRLPPNVVKEMFFTAAPVDAQQAERWLLINHLVPSATLERKTFEIAETIAAKAPLAIATVKEQLRVLCDYQPIAAQVFERVQGLRRQTYDSDDYTEGITAFREKRRPVFHGR
jgi:methylmalonyl-CoA decarboxylase